MDNLLNLSCKHYEKGASALEQGEISRLLSQVDGWKMTDDGIRITKTFRFRNYYETIAFVNAIAWLIHAEDHHPELTVTYNTCTIQFNTHTVNGLTMNDFICAAKINALHDSSQRD